MGTSSEKWSAPYWAVLRECGYGTLQLYWFSAGYLFYNGMLSANGATLRQVLKADPSVRQSNTLIMLT